MYRLIRHAVLSCEGGFIAAAVSELLSDISKLFGRELGRSAALVSAGGEPPQVSRLYFGMDCQFAARYR